MLSLVLLIPNQEPMGLAVALLVLGLARGTSLVRQAFKARNVIKNKPNTFLVIRDYALPLCATIGLLVVTLEIFYGQFGALILLVGVVSAFLVTACQNAWSLLMEQSGALE